MLNFLQNFFGVATLVAIVVVSALATLSLSPSGGIQSDTNQSQRVAGVSDPQILSNYIPLSFRDRAQVGQSYQPQLVEVTEGEYDYNVVIGPLQQGHLFQPMLSVTNKNSAPVEFTVTASAASELGGLVHIAIADPTNSYRVIDANTNLNREIKFTVPANSILDIKLEYEALIALNFPAQVTFAINAN